MEQFRGQLMRNGNVIIDHVEGRFDVDSAPGGVVFWSGYFAVPAGDTVECDEPFELVLADGRSKKIRIERVNQGAAGVTASFGRA